MIAVVIGMVGLNRVMTSPAFATYRTVDVVQLLGSGACLGVAMVMLIFALRGVRPQPSE